MKKPYQIAAGRASSERGNGLIEKNSRAAHTDQNSS